MADCVRCKKRLGFFEQVCIIRDNRLPEYNGKTVCKNCEKEINKELIKKIKSGINRNCSQCIFFNTDVETIDAGVFVPDLKIFQLTNCSKFGFDIKEGSEAETCTSYITHADYKAKALSGQLDENKSKTSVQIVLDFSSLKDEMTKGGIVMTTYKCPNCSALIDIPETGKFLVCSHCGTAIKPVDIFEKIKSLISDSTKEKPSENAAFSKHESDEIAQDNDDKSAWFREAIKQHDY